MIQTHDMQVVSVPVGDLRQHPDNANTSDMDALEESMVVNGFFSPILVQASTGFIIAGNHRWLVAVKNDLPTVPAIRLDVSDLEAKRIMLADNRISRLGHDDEALLFELLQDIAQDDDELLGTGYTPGDLDELRQLNEEPLHYDEMEPEPPPPQEDVIYQVIPVEGHDGRAYEISVSRLDGAHLTPGDLNKIRKGLGMSLMERSEMSQFSIEAWNRSF